MELKEKLRDLMSRQKDFLREYEDALKEFESNDFVNQNIELNKELESYKKSLDEVKKKYQEVSDENQGLKTALREQILDEKLSILKISKEKVQTYFEDLSSQYNNGLIALEMKAEEKRSQLSHIAAVELGAEGIELNEQMNKFNLELKNKINQKKESFTSSKNEALNGIDNDIERLKSGEVSQEIIQKRMRRNDIEIKIGLNLINKIGIFLILLGVVYALRYSYINWFAPYMKGIFSFVLGGLFVAGGEWFNKKGKDIFAKGLIGGGVAILYYAIFNAYFVFNLFELPTALILSMLVTATALILSVFHDSETIGSLALVGGYLPFFTYVFKFGLREESMYLAMGYLFILNLLVLLIAINKRWSVINYVSFILNVPSLIYLVFDAQNKGIGITYSFLTFAMYLGVTLTYPLKYKLSLKVRDVILIALNTFISCIITYSLFKSAMLDSYLGLLAFIFCLTYFGLGQFLSIYMREEKSSQIIFYVTSLTFAILAIPFQFGIEGLAIGWLIEGVLLTIFGFKGKLKSLEIGGWVIMALCVVSFYFVEVLGTALEFQLLNHFQLKYFSLMLGLTLVMFTYLFEMKNDPMQKYTFRGNWVTAYKYFTVLNLWIYVSYITVHLYHKYISMEYAYNDFYATVLFSFVTILFAYVISKIQVVTDRIVEYFAIFLYILTDIVCLGINAGMPVSNQDVTLKYVSILVLIFYNILVFLNVKDLIIRLVRRGTITLEMLPLSMAIYLLGTITILMIQQFNLGEYNLLFSLFYLVGALGCIIYGFKYKYIMIRRFGLGLSIFANVKLFIFDLHNLDMLGKIIAYFGFGFMMLGISFVYQKLKNSQDTPKNGVEM